MKNFILVWTLACMCFLSLSYGNAHADENNVPITSGLQITGFIAAETQQYLDPSGNYINYLEATDFVFPLIGKSQKNTKDPLTDGWRGPGVGMTSARNGHLGQDYFLSNENSDGKPVFSIANGVIVEVLNGPGRFGWCDNGDHGWGPVVVIKHTLKTGFNVPSDAVVGNDGCGTDLQPTDIYSLYGHLSRDSIKNLFIGKAVTKGETIGVIGKRGVDQDKWDEHLHFEIKDEAGFLEGTWFKSNPGTCQGSTIYKCYQRVIKGVGTAYSEQNGFAPHRYVPSVFLSANMINPKFTVSKAGTGDGTIKCNDISCDGICSDHRPMGTVVTLTASPVSGSIFKGWTVDGTIVSGCASSGNGPCEVRLDADTVVTGTFSPAVVNPPKLTGSVFSIRGMPSANVMTVYLKITNTGTGNAQNIIINNFGFKTLAGSGNVTYNTSLSPPTPITFGNLNVGESKTITLVLNVPSTVLRFSISEGGQVQNELCEGATFQIAQTVFK